MSDKPVAVAPVKLSPDELAREAEQGNFKKVNDLLADYMKMDPKQFKSIISGVEAANQQHVIDDRKAVEDYNSKWWHLEKAKPTLPTLIFTDSNGDKIPDKISGFILQDGTKIAKPEAAVASPKPPEKEGRTFSFGPNAAEKVWTDFYPKK